MPRMNAVMPLILALALASCGQQAVQTVNSQPENSATILPVAEDFDESTNDSVVSDTDTPSELNSLAINPWPTFASGASGWQIKAAQYLLNYHNQTNVLTDSQFGPATKNAVHTFQVSHGLPTTDKLDAATWAKLIVVVKLGDNNEAVKALQSIFKLEEDGNFGPKTEAAVYNFQNIRGLTPDRIAGPETWQALIAGGKKDVPSRVTLAKQVLANKNITLARGDSTSPYQNVVDTANGKIAASGCHGDGNCGAHVYLDARMLSGLLKVGQSYKVYITSITGSGAHMAGSHHYMGRAVDIGLINDRRVSASNPYVTGVEKACDAGNAISILGPGDKGHATHVHCAW